LAVSAVFLDRDGVINRKAPDGDYIKSWEEFAFLPGAVEAIKILNESGWKVIVVTNQRGIALGLMTEADVEEIHKKLSLEIQKHGAHIDRIYYCPHEKGSCSCRKPDIGMFLKAKEDFPELSFSSSFVVGDSSSDMEAGKSLACKLILITENSSTIDQKAGYHQAISLYTAVQKYIVTGK
jgi:D-glycero-D-manno-heptose 1,7-bisphosphate phosphatase